jgi:tRNA pseudouridine38-40 synthase
MPMSIPYFLHVSYVGTNFFGWQIQTSLRSVQRELWNAIKIIEPNLPIPMGTSRTDAGVHAKYQGVLIILEKEWDHYRLLSAINAHLPHDIRVMAVKGISELFSPRRHTVAKRYIYHIKEGYADDPLCYKRQWHIFGSLPLNKNNMAQAAKYLIGTHDFSSFRQRECSAKSPYKTIYDIVVKENNGVLDISLEGNSFLMHMVRIIVGTLVGVGKGRYSISDIENILAAKDRKQAWVTAPPYGLYLDYIWYQDYFGLNEPLLWL